MVCGVGFEIATVWRPPGIACVAESGIAPQHVSAWGPSVAHVICLLCCISASDLSSELIDGAQSSDSLTEIVTAQEKAFAAKIH